MDITVIIIPPLQVEAISQQQINSADLDTYQRLVEGHIEAVRLTGPPASMYLNEEGKLIGLPLNIRATQLAWAHNTLLRGRDLIVGPALLTGPPTGSGYDTTVPRKYRDELLPEGPWRVEMLAVGETRWTTDSIEYPLRESAFGAARDLWRRQATAAKSRVVPTSTPPNQSYENVSEHVGWGVPNAR